MDTTEEQPVTKEETGSAAFTAARASIAAQSPDHGATDAKPPQGDDIPDEKPAEQPDKPADQPPASGDETDGLLTPEELAALPPKERAKAEKWQAKLTQKAQALSAKGKDFEEWEPLIAALKTNPGEAVAQLATQLGLKMEKPVAQDTRTVETKTAEAMADLPEEWQFLKPVFERFGKTLMDSVRGEIAPIREAHTAMASEAAAAETESTIKAFDAKYPGWKTHEAQMLDIGKKFIPASGSMTDFEYMETLHKLATADVKKAEQVKTTVERINKSAASVEPNTPGISDSRVEHAMPPPEKRSMRDAFNAAKQGIRWQK